MRYRREWGNRGNCISNNTTMKYTLLKNNRVGKYNVVHSDLTFEEAVIRCIQLEDDDDLVISKTLEGYNIRSVFHPDWRIEYKIVRQ